MTPLWEQANASLRDLISYEPGKPVEDLARELGIAPGDIVKLASNENPLGPSPKALAAMRDTLERANFYPDGGGYYLREAIAEKNGLRRENVILGCGSNEIIEFLGHAFLQPGDEVVTSDHAFAVYRLMAQLFGAKTVEVPERPASCKTWTPRSRPSPRARGRCTSPARTIPPAQSSRGWKSSGS